MRAAVSDFEALDGRRHDPVVEAYKAGLDRSLVRQNLRRSPTDRLENLQALQSFADELRRAGARQRRPG